MRRVGGFVGVLLVGLAALSLAGYFALTSITREWFAKDLASRSRLAIAAARTSLERSFASDPDRLEAVLADIARDERIMGGAACSLDGRAVASTAAYPIEFPCATVVASMRTSALPHGRAWSTVASLPTGRVQLHAEPIRVGGVTAGVVVLVHDLRFLD